MVRMTESPGQFIVSVTKREAIRIIESIAGQLYNDNCNRDRIEFRRQGRDDVEYFSIAVDESNASTEFHVMTNLIDGLSMNDMVLYRSNNLEDAQEFMTKFIIEIAHSTMWIKEVTV